MSITLQVVTANIGRGASAEKVEDRVKALRARFPHAVIGWQELDEADTPDEHGIVQRVFRKRRKPGHQQAGFRTATPITVPPEWKLVRQRITRTCEGKTGASPHRVAVQALIEHRVTKARVVIVNGHYPRDEIADLWLDCHRSWVKVIERWQRKGYTIITTRDTNKPKTPKFHHSERVFSAPNRIDLITLIPSNHPKRVAQVGTFRRGPRLELGIDGHDALSASLTIS